MVKKVVIIWVDIDGQDVEFEFEEATRDLVRFDGTGAVVQRLQPDTPYYVVVLAQTFNILGRNIRERIGLTDTDHAVI